jgi:predicted N-acetyltransferase YhbS
MTRRGLYDALKRITPLRSVVRRVRAAFEQTRVEVWMLTGSERRSGEPLQALIAGQLETKNYLAALLFEQPYTETHRRMWRWRALRKATARGSAHAIAFFDTTVRTYRHAQRGNVFWLRGWVRTELELARAAERIQRSDGIKSDVRRIHENRLACDTTADPQALEQFYWNMYAPYARQGFGDKAIYMSYEQMKAGLNNPQLLRVSKDGQILAGMIILHPESGVPHWWILGMRDGDRRLVRQGVLAALYLFGVQHLMDRGYRRALLGGVRPFLADGILQYKRKWGARLIAGDDGDPHWLMVVVTQSTGAVRGFLKACPFVGEDEHGLVGRVFFDEAEFDDSERVRRQAAELAALGVDRVRAIQFLPIGVRSGHVLQEAQEIAGLGIGTGPLAARPSGVSLPKDVKSVRD